jgi:chromosome segregation ATPase
VALTVKIAELEQDRARANAEGVELLAVSSKLKLRVQSLEHDKAKLLSEIEELNRWLQRPAAEKKQLASKLDEVSCAMQGLQLENSQLISQISKLEKEVHQRQEENQILSYRVLSLEEEISHVISELTATNLEQKQMEEGKQLVDTLLEDSRLLVQELRHQNDSLNSDILMLMEEKGNMMSDLRVLQQQMQEVSYPSFVITDFSNSELLGFHTGKETRFSSWLMKVQWYSQVRRKLKSPKF